MKKTLSFVLSAIMVLALLTPVTAFADGQLTLTCSDISCNAGDSITVNVLLSNNPGFNGLQLTPVYNSEVMTLKDPENGDIISDIMTGYNYNWLNGNTDTFEEGLLVSLKFDVLSTAPTGEYEVGFNYVQCISVKNGVQSVPVTVVPATVTVTGVPEPQYTVGDLDNDGAVTDADAVYLLMYTFFPEDYPLNQPGDFDGDGQVTDADAVYLLMYTFFPEDYPIVKQQSPKEPTDPGETEPDPFED